MLAVLKNESSEKRETKTRKDSAAIICRVIRVPRTTSILLYTCLVLGRMPFLPEIGTLDEPTCHAPREDEPIHYCSLGPTIAPRGETTVPVGLLGLANEKVRQ